MQPELPVWVTTAGNPDTYREAARLGANVLTHLLGQSITELADKIQIYRDALKECGRNPADYKVTLMLHTLIGDDREQVREQARQPMKDYLRSAAALIKQYAWAFPAFKKPQGVTQPMESTCNAWTRKKWTRSWNSLSCAISRIAASSAPSRMPRAKAEELKAIGVDEIACLIDFGVSHAVALEALEPLAEVVSRINPQAEAPAEPAHADYGVAALINRHGVSHIQCTPSMATKRIREIVTDHPVFLDTGPWGGSRCREPGIPGTGSADRRAHAWAPAGDRATTS